MFYGEERIREVRLLLLSRPGSTEEKNAIEKLEKLQVEDILDLFRAAGGVKWVGDTASSGSVSPFEDPADAPKPAIPITFRLIDPPVSLSLMFTSILLTTPMS